MKVIIHHYHHKNHLWISSLIIIVLVFLVIILNQPTTTVTSSRIRVRRNWCRGSRRLEHLRGHCMYHYECVQQHGISIGHCFTNLFVGSCCMILSYHHHQQQDDRKQSESSKLMIMPSSANSAIYNIIQKNLQNPNKNNEIQSKHIGGSSSSSSLVTSTSSSKDNVFGAARGTFLLKMDNNNSETTTTTTTTTGPIKSQTIRNLNDDGDEDVDSENDDKLQQQPQRQTVDQNPIKLSTTVITTAVFTNHINGTTISSIGCDQNDHIGDGGDDSIISYSTNDSSNNSTTTPVSSSLMDDSIITPNTTTTVSQPKPIEVNQNEFYEIVPGSSSTTTTTTTTTSSLINLAGNLTNTDQELLIPDRMPLPPPLPLPNDELLLPPQVMPIVVSTSTSFPPPISTTPRSHRFQTRPCGVRPLRPTGRVVGGRNAQFGEWPWQVLIKEKSWLGFFTKSKCGGVLIDYKWILTAAHCQPGMMGSLIVMLGQHELHGTSRQLRPVVKTVRRMIVHRDFDPDTFDNDIALLELDTPFEMQPHIVPICLPQSDENYVGQYAYVAGWGKLSYGGMIPSILQTVRLPIIDNRVCQTMFADAGHYKYIRDSFLCAGYPQGGRDTCEGDSGGPLMMKKDDVWTLIGTVSHGIKCAEPNLPGVYMKTWAYLPWIRGIIDRN